MNEITWSFMVSRIMAPKDVQIVISATCAYVTLHGRASQSVQLGCTWARAHVSLPFRPHTAACCFARTGLMGQAQSGATGKPGNHPQATPGSVPAPSSCQRLSAQLGDRCCCSRKTFGQEGWDGPVLCQRHNCFHGLCPGCVVISKEKRLY